MVDAIMSSTSIDPLETPENEESYSNSTESNELLPDIEAQEGSDKAAWRDVLANTLIKALEVNGSVPLGEVHAWLEKNNAPGHFIFWGSGGNRRYWHIEGDSLTYGGKPKGQVQPARPPSPSASPTTVRRVAVQEARDPTVEDNIPDPSVLESPTDQMEAIARQIGIRKASATALAAYVCNSYDVDDPRQVWEALQEVKEVTPSLRKRLWRTWCSFRGADPPKDLIDMAEQSVQKSMVRTVTGNDAAPVRTSSARLYIVYKGEVLPTSSDDPDGMTFYQALTMADRQEDRAEQKAARTPTRRDTDPMVDIMTKVFVPLFTASATQRPSGPSAEVQLLESEMRHSKELAEMRMKALEERTQQQIELVSTSIDRLADAIRSGAQSQPAPAPKSFWDQLFDNVPGVKEKMSKMILGGNSDDNSNTRVPWDRFKDVNGNPIAMDVGTIERMEALSNEREKVKVFRDTLGKIGEEVPNFIEAFVRERREKDEQKQQQGQQQMPTVTCKTCGTQQAYAPGYDQIVCGKCRMVMDTSGTAIRQLQPVSATAQNGNGHTPPPTRPAPPALSEPPQDDQPSSEPIIEQSNGGMQ
jgi:hypothetical protein